jgi:hypothetical protein
MTEKPQFDHKNPRFCEVSQNSRLGYDFRIETAAVDLAFCGQRNDLIDLEGIAGAGRGAVAGGGAGRMGLRP